MKLKDILLNVESKLPAAAPKISSLPFPAGPDLPTLPTGVPPAPPRISEYIKKVEERLPAGAPVLSGRLAEIEAKFPAAPAPPAAPVPTTTTAKVTSTGYRPFTSVSGRVAVSPAGYRYLE